MGTQGVTGRGDMENLRQRDTEMVASNGVLGVLAE